MTAKGPYEGYDVLAKWDSPSFNSATRAALARRLDLPPGPRFFEAAAYRTLEAACRRLLPQPDRTDPIPVAALIDDRMAAGEGGEGYRNADMPPLPEAWRLGLEGLDGEARSRFGAAFADLAPERQDAVLQAVQAGEVDARGWKLPAVRFFRDLLLKSAAGLYYAHPEAWSEIGFGGPASPRGYVRLGLGERDPWEARERHGR